MKMPFLFSFFLKRQKETEKIEEKTEFYSYGRTEKCLFRCRLVKVKWSIKP